MAFLSIPNMDTTFQTCTIRQRCKERTCVKKGGCGKAKFVYFSSAVSHACKLIQDQDKLYNIMNASSSNTACWQFNTLYLTLAKTSIADPLYQGNPFTRWVIVQQKNLYPLTHNTLRRRQKERRKGWRVLYVIIVKCTPLAPVHVFN